MNKKVSSLSIVIPVYGCAGCLDELVSRLAKVLQDVASTWEIILVDDGSKDSAWEVISALIENFPNVIGVELSRNFGQHRAITAGLSVCKGDWVVIMDGDLQDQPEEIPQLIDGAIGGYDVVLARRANRKDRLIKRISSKIFYKILGALTDQEYSSEIANFGCYKRSVIEAVLSLGDYTRFFPLFVKWVGYRTTSVEVVHAKRETGKTAYTFKRAYKLAVDAILAFSDKPLRLIVSTGFFLSIVSFVVAIFYFIGALKKLYIVQGWATIIISMWFLAGFITFLLGLIGLYIARIFDQTKNRPVFIIRQILSKEPNRPQ
jgi:polyisoprenyl-phosphate glycosyltransferase